MECGQLRENLLLRATHAQGVQLNRAAYAETEILRKTAEAERRSPVSNQSATYQRLYAEFDFTVEFV
ncbi:hypothetical protein WJ97_11485 [Burkholderia ubonensis]|uniref:hypothetical protein n=1 Tax=Burkholderia ubonensis TaxID=101571 RepID=UPI000770C642|nr:hypothetical protein [Burkholderia ubonensis]KVP96502.1 hypothetical protein WJ97_11485 [Burkholderia ubonensis]